MMFLRFIRINACDSIPRPLSDSARLFILPHVDGYLVCFCYSVFQKRKRCNVHLCMDFLRTSVRVSDERLGTRVSLTFPPPFLVLLSS